MATIDVTASWNDGDPQTKLRAKRAGVSFETWAEETTAIVLYGGVSTDPASGMGEPLTHVIVWTKDNHFRTQLYYRVYKWDGSKIARVQDWKNYAVK